jgi:TolB protein
MWRNFGVWVAAVVLTGGGGSIVATATVADDPYTIAFGSFASVRPTVFIADGNGEHILPLLTNPDVVGDRMVCNSGIAGIAHNAILMMNADGSNRRVLFNDPERSAVAPASSPRGDRIAFALGQFFPMVPGREQVKSQLALIATDGLGLRLLAAAGDRAGFPSWAPDGKRLVYRSADTQRRGLRIIDLATNRVTQLTNGPNNDNFLAWSPKGDRIAFTTDCDGVYEIYSIRPDGSELRRLTRSPGNDGHLSWSPDGEWIAFASARTGFLDEPLLHPDNGQATGEIFVMRADGSDVRRLTANPWEDATPAWKPLLAASSSTTTSDLSTRSESKSSIAVA